MNNITIKLIFLIFVFLLSPIRGGAQSQYSDVLSKMEKTLFNMDYSSQSEEARLRRIEENVYGSSSIKPAQERVDKLLKDLSAEVIGQEIKPKKDSFLQDDEIIVKQSEETMDYALVNGLERKVFKYEFKTLDLHHRLCSLEWQVFKKNYTADDLNTRINRLKDAVMYQKFPVDDDTKIAKTLTPQQKKELDSNIQLISLEKSLFATSFPNEKSSDRLVRLESKVFNSTFLDDDNQTRLNRIDGAYKAKSSASKYKSNRASQRTATAIELGTLFLIILPFLL